MVIKQRRTGIATVDKTVKEIYDVLKYLRDKLNKGIRVEIEDGAPVIYFKNWRIKERFNPMRLQTDYLLPTHPDADAEGWVNQRDLSPEENDEW